MIQINHLHKSFGTQDIFKDLNFSIAKGEKVGFLGRNGTGKTTLFRILTKDLTADAGEIRVPKNYKIACLPQHIEFHSDTVIEECKRDVSLTCDSQLYRLEKILFGLGFTKDELLKNPKHFSGGYQLRINLAKILANEADMLLLDEPSNYLDILSLRWLKNYLKSFKGEFILITHDREFMDSVITHTMGLNRFQIRKFEGKTSKYFEQLEQDDMVFERTQKNIAQQRQHLEGFVERFRAQANKASQAQSKLKQLQKLPTLECVEKDKNLVFSFNYKKCDAKDFLSVNDLSFSYGTNQVINELAFEIKQGDRIAVIGKNGQGKSTLLNLLANVLTPCHGTIKYHPNIAIGHFGQTNISHLNQNNTVVEEIQSADFTRSIKDIRAICGAMLFEGDLAEKKIKVLSGGEKSRVLLGKLLVLPTNLLLLDEPTNHLDVESVEVLMKQVQDYPGCVVMVTHNEGIIKKFATKLLTFQSTRTEFFDGNYDYFLQKVGWDDEMGVTGANKTVRKELKRSRSELIKERAQTLGPMKSNIDSLEGEIMSLEEELTSLQDQLMRASMMSNATEIASLSKKISNNKRVIDEKFSLLEKVVPQYEELREDFEIKLNQLK